MPDPIFNQPDCETQTGSEYKVNIDNSIAALAEAMPAGRFQKLRIKNNSGTPNTQIDINADVIIVSDGSTYKALLSVDQTIDFTTNGANGLDTGSLAASTIYFLHEIAKADGTKAAMGSLSAVAPTTYMPSGYTFSRLLGFVKTDGSSHFLVSNQKDNILMWDDMVEVVSGNTARSWTDENLGAFISSISTRTLLKGNLETGNINTASLKIRRNGSAAANGQLYLAQAAGSYIQNTIVSWVDTDGNQVVEINFAPPAPATVNYIIYCLGCLLDI